MNLILLHGALGCAGQFQQLRSALLSAIVTHAPEFYGHGNTPMGIGFTIPDLARQVVGFMDENGIAQAAFFGHSMGGYVALHLANTHPQRVAGVFTLGTMLHWTPEVLHTELKRMDAAKIEEKVPAYAAMLTALHRHGWKPLLENCKSLVHDLVQHNYVSDQVLESLSCPVRLAIGDSDTTAGVQHTLTKYQHLKRGQLEVLPGTGHPFEQADANRLAESIKSFVAAVCG